MSQSILPTNLKPRCRRTKPFILYHWSPSSRRKSILRNGLVVGSRHSIHSKGWRADYLCLSDSPSFAWAYSADTSETPKEWDLWMMWSTAVEGLYYRADHKGRMPAEYRSNHSIKKKWLWLVGSRKNKAKK